MPTLSYRAKLLLTAGFACTGGWADVICFKRYEGFAALMTGNAIKVGIAAATQSRHRAANVVFYLSVMLSYMVGVAIFQQLKSCCGNRTGRVAAVVCFTLVLASDILYDAFKGDKWQVCLLAPAFGIQNSLTFGGPMEINTTIITGNMQKLGVALHQVVTGKMTRNNLRNSAGPAVAVIATIIAAVAGAFVLMEVTKMDPSWLFLPSGVLQGVCMWMYDMCLQYPTPSSDVVTCVQATNLRECDATVVGSEHEFTDASCTQQSASLQAVPAGSAMPANCSKCLPCV